MSRPSRSCLDGIWSRLKSTCDGRCSVWSLHPPRATIHVRNCPQSQHEPRAARRLLPTRPSCEGRQLLRLPTGTAKVVARRPGACATVFDHAHVANKDLELLLQGPPLRLRCRQEHGRHSSVAHSDGVRRAFAAVEVLRDPHCVPCAAELDYILVRGALQIHIAVRDRVVTNQAQRLGERSRDVLIK